MITLIELRQQVFADLLAKSGVNETSDVNAMDRILVSALYAAQVLFDGQIPEKPVDTGIIVMATQVFKIGPGTAVLVKSSGGTAITLASLANGNGTSAGGRQAATIDLTASWSRLWRIQAEFELAATPTAGNAINIFGSFHSATGAGNGNTSGSDAAYTGYSNNIDAATKQLVYLGSHICTSQATSTVQKSNVGVFMPTGRFLNLVVDNRSGAAFHSSDSNCVITLTPLDESVG